MAIYVSSEEQRVNWMGALYADIAVENYYLSKRQYGEMISSHFEYYDDIQDGYETAIKHAVTAVVFSAMAIEALLNDFGVECMRSKAFFQSFDKLSVIDKMCFIVEFIFHKPFDKSQAYYSSLKALINHRNAFVHSKSDYPTDEQFEEFMSYYEYDPQNPDTGKEAFEADYKEEAKRRMLMARDAIKAMHHITQYIDENDPEYHSTLRLLLPQIIEGDKRLIMTAKEDVYPELGIKLQYVVLR